MMNGLEKVVGILIGSYVAMNEWRIRSFVQKDRFQDLREDVIRMEGKVDKLLTKNGIDPEGN